jgi:hypothetical protein
MEHVGRYRRRPPESRPHGARGGVPPDAVHARDILIRDFGVEKTDKIFFEAGKKAGQEYCENILTEKKDLDGLFADLQRTMKELGIGISGLNPPITKRALLW